jgi:hypothetical protein
MKNLWWLCIRWVDDDGEKRRFMRFNFDYHKLKGTAADRARQLGESYAEWCFAFDKDP